MVKTPTCSQKGLVERVCRDCGEKVYEDVETAAHTYLNGKCTVCGIIFSNENNLPIIEMPMDSNNEAAWNIRKIYDIAKTCGAKKTYEEFFDYFSMGDISEAYIDTLGIFHFTMTSNEKYTSVFEMPLAFYIGRVSPKNSTGTDFGTLYRLEVENGILVFTYTNGSKLSAGRVVPTNSKNEVLVTAFGINTDNEMVLYYSNGTIGFAGKISEGVPAKNQSNFSYVSVYGGYSISQAISIEGNQVLKIPVSHRGLPIISIKDYAFGKNMGSVNSIVIPEGIKIESLAFELMPENIEIYLEGYKNEYDFNFNSISAKVYQKGEWRYVGDNPTPNR